MSNEPTEEEPKRVGSKSQVRWWRRAIFIFPILVAIGFSGIAAAFFLGEGTGTGTTSVPSGTPSTIPITVTAQPTLEVSGSLTGLTPWTTNTNTPSATDEVFALWQLDTSTPVWSPVLVRTRPMSSTRTQGYRLQVVWRPGIKLASLVSIRMEQAPSLLLTMSPCRTCFRRLPTMAAVTPTRSALPSG